MSWKARDWVWVVPIVIGYIIAIDGLYHHVEDEWMTGLTMSAFGITLGTGMMIERLKHIKK